MYLEWETKNVTHVQVHIYPIFEWRQFEQQSKIKMMGMHCKPIINCEQENLQG